MTSDSRPSLRQDETGKKYGSFIVLGYAGAKRGKALWSVHCSLCDHEAVSRGVDLRKGIYPRHKCIRVCRDCGKSEHETEFDKNRQVGNICSNCKKKFIKSWREENVEYRADYKRQWNTDSPDKIIKYQKQERVRRQSSPANFIKELVGIKRRNMAHLPNSKDKRAQQKAKTPERRIFTITVEDVVALWDKQNGRCAISGMPMAHEFKNLRSVSIDRIDSDLGYTLDNIQLVCQWVNYAKNRYSNAEIGEVLTEYKSMM